MLDDPEVLAGLAGRVDGLPAKLHAPVGVGKGAGFFGEGRGRQDHIRIAAGLGEKYVLHYAMFKPGEGGAGMAQIGIRHGRVFAHDIQPREIAVMDGVHDLDHGLARFRVKRRAPKLFEFFPVLVNRHGLIVGIDHGDQAHIGGPLHVILPAQRVQAGIGPADLAGHERQGDQAAGIVGAVRMLRDAHAPEDDRGFGRGISPRDLPDTRRLNAADRRDRLRAVFEHSLFQGLKAMRVRVNKSLIVQLFADYGVHHRVQQQHIRAGPKLRQIIVVQIHLGAVGFDQDQPAAALHGILHKGRGDRVIIIRARADHDDHLRVRAVGDLVGDRRRADGLQQGGHGRGVTQARAMIHIIAAKPDAHQLLHQIRLFIAAFCAAEPGQRARPPRVADPPEAAGGQIQRLFPGGLAKIAGHLGGLDQRRRPGRAFPPDQGSGQAIRMMRVVETITALDAQAALVGRPVAPLDILNAVILHIKAQQTAHAAIRAGRGHLFIRLGEAHIAGRHQRPGRARLHAFTAGHAGALAHGRGHIEHDLRFMAAKGIADHIIDLLLAAGPHTAGALNAGVQIDGDGRMGQIRRHGLALSKAGFVNLEPVGPVIQFRAQAIGRLALRGHIGQQQFDHHLLRAQRAFIIAVNPHPGGRLPTTGGRERPFALDLDHAGAAITVRAIAFLVA